MTTSGSYDFEITRGEMVSAVLRKLGKVSEDVAVTAYQTSQVVEALNLVVQQLPANYDRSPNSRMWTIKRATVFLQSGQESYTLGPNGDPAAYGYDETTLSANADSGASTVVVTSASGIASGDEIGVVLTSGSVHWTTVNGTPAGTTVTLTAVLPSAAAAGKTVWTYTESTQGIQKPLIIRAASIRDADGNDRLLDEIILQNYEAIPDKDAEGDPCAFYYEEGLTDGVLFLDAAPTDATDKLLLTFLRPIQDFDASSDTPDLPKVWHRFLVWKAAEELIPEFGVSGELAERIEKNATEAYGIAINANPEEADVFFEPGR